MVSRNPGLSPTRRSQSPACKLREKTDEGYRHSHDYLSTSLLPWCPKYCCREDRSGWSTMWRIRCVKIGRWAGAHVCRPKESPTPRGRGKHAESVPHGKM
jgi:hypothetical protein